MSDDDLIRRGDALLACDSVTSAGRMRYVPAAKPKVRALVWRDDDEGVSHHASDYSIHFDGSHYSLEWLNCRILSQHTTLEAAMAAAQADYETRILAALEWDAAPDTARSEAFRAGAEAMRESIAREFDELWHAGVAEAIRTLPLPEVPE